MDKPGPNVVTRRRSAAWPAVLAAAAALHCGPPAAMADEIRLVLPLACELGRSCAVQNYVDHDPAAGARDYQCGTLTYDRHNGTDFRLPDSAILRAGVEVYAAADGEVERVRDGMADRAVAAADAFDDTARSCGNGVIISHRDGWQTQYCHMAKGSVSVVPGERVVAGQPIGRVGLSGNTQFPHLHFTVRHGGQVVDPFAYGAGNETCGSGRSLWRAPGSGFAYQARTLLNAGFAPGPVTMDQIESGSLSRQPGRDAPALVAFVRVIGLRTGDVQRLTIIVPGQRTLVDHTAAPLDRAKAQAMLFAGKKRPAKGWPAGSYDAQYTVSQNGTVVFQKHFSMTF